MMRILFGLTLLLLVSFAIWFSIYTAKKTPSYVQNNTIKILPAIAHWENRIDQKGPEEAHDEMVRDGNSLQPSLRHTLAHTFGEALYNHGDLSYVAYCGSEFLFGCSHQFIGLATSEFGPQAIQQLQKACEEKNEALLCAHGIGHGLLSTYGYTKSGIMKSLSECHRMYDLQKERGICADGAFMEYNLQEITTLDQDRIPRPFTKEHALEPCVSIPQEFSDECVYELPLWWALALKTSTAAGDDNREMGTLCRMFPDQHRQHVCFLGIGFPVAQHNTFIAEDIKHSCEAAAVSPQESMLCLTGAAERYRENGLPIKNICNTLGLTNSSLTYCERYTRLPRQEAYALDVP